MYLNCSIRDESSISVAHNIPIDVNPNLDSVEKYFNYDYNARGLIYIKLTNGHYFLLMMILKGDIRKRVK